MKGMVRARSWSYGADPERIGQRSIGIGARWYEFVRDVTRVAKIGDSTRNGVIVEFLTGINFMSAGHATRVEMPNPLNVVLDGPDHVHLP